jgi:hypothetical protein
MSEVKVGDRVRITAEGVVRQWFADGEFRLVGGGTYAGVGDSGVVSVEVIEPPFVLPTKRLAQVTADGVLWTLTGSGMWANLVDGRGRHAKELIKSSNLRVISEGVDDE